jgi:tRNA (cmo5U34)-methyltransferase
MTADNTTSFDVNPPMPVGDWDATARMVNAGYELVFELATALLRAHCPAEAHLLLVGAGGGMEVRTFAAAEPGWRLTGVDPSAEMLALAQAKAEASGQAGRVRLLRGTVDDLPAEARFDAATLFYTLMYLPDDGSKLRLLRGIAARLRPGALFLLVDATTDRRARFLPAWRRYTEARGMPAAQMAALLERLAGRVNAVTEARELALLDEAGFHDVAPFCAVFHGTGWVATV